MIARRTLLVALAVVALAVLTGAGGSDSLISPPSFAVGGSARPNAAAFAVAPLSSPRRPTFDLNIAQIGSGPSLLSPSLTVDGTAMTLMLDCDARNISGATWACATGGTFTESGSGTSPTSGLAAPFTDAGARAVVAITSGKFYTAPLSSTAQIGTQDFAIEYEAQATAGKSYLSNLQGGSAASYEISGNPGSCAPTLNIKDGTTSVVAVASAPGSCNGSHNHVILFADRSAGVTFFVNGAAAGTTSISTAPGSLSSVSTTEILSRPGGIGQNDIDGPLSFVRVWVCPPANPNCFTTSVQTTLAAQRFAQLTGTNASIAAGQSWPLSFTRATTAMIDIDRDGDGIRRLFTMGAGWPRVVARKDSGATLRSAFLSEGPSTNLALQSQTLDDVAWTKTAAAISANVQSAPDGTAAGDGIVPDATTGVHGIGQSPTLTAVTYAFSFFVKAGNRNFVDVRDNTGGTKEGTWTISTCAQNRNTFTTGLCEDYGNGWKRVSVTFTGTAAAHALEIRASSDGVDTAYAGDAVTVGISVWGAQVEAQSLATSYITTTSATVTRNKDELLYSPTGNALTSIGTLDIAFICPTTTILSSGSFRPGTIGDGANNTVLFTSGGTTDLIAQYATGGVSQASIDNAAATIGNNAVHSARMTYQTNDVRYFYDGLVVGTDSSATMIADGTATRISLMNNGAAATGGQIGCMATRMRVWPAIIVGGVQP